MVAGIPTFAYYGIPFNEKESNKRYLNLLSTLTRKYILLLQRVEKIVKDHTLLHPGDRVIVAVSGGADSLALLHLLHDLPLDLHLHVVYVDHGLRPTEVCIEIETIEKVCRKMGLHFETTSVDTKCYMQKEKTSLEEAARILRYQALHSIRKRRKANSLAVAHTADDQVEEFLLRLIRGTGRKGLSGMSVKNDYIIRPLLQEPKAALLAYLNDKGIRHCEDSSNEQRVFLRNRIRLDLLPLLENTFNASIRRNILQTQEILHHEENLLEELTDEKYQTVVTFEDHGTDPSPSGPPAATINIPSCLACHRALRRRILEKVCWAMATRPSFRQIEQLDHLLTKGKVGAETHLSSGLRIIRHKDTLSFTHPQGVKPFRGRGKEEALQVYRKIPSPGIFDLEELGMTLEIHLLEEKPTTRHGNYLLLDDATITFPLLLRTPEPGEKFSPLGMEGKKKITRFLSDKKIAQEMRGHHPVLVLENKVIAILGLQIDHDHRITENTKQYLQISWEKTTR